jgi:hypothetical protein
MAGNKNPLQTSQTGAQSSSETVNQLRSATRRGRNRIDEIQPLTPDFVDNKFPDTVNRLRSATRIGRNRIDELQPLTSGPPEDIWLTQGYNRKFSITDLKNKITGLNQLSKFYFDFPEIRNKTFDRKTGEKSLFSEWYTEKHFEVLRNLYFYSENITIPMRGINTDPHTYANGFRFEAPTGSNYGDGDISISMMVDHKYEIYDFFMKWMNSVHDKDTGYFSFHNRYTTNLDIYQLNNIGVKFSENNDMENMIADKTKNFFNYRVHLGNCYPKSVSAIEFKHDSRDERVKITVNFTYEKVMYNHELTK